MTFTPRGIAASTSRSAAAAVRRVPGVVRRAATGLAAYEPPLTIPQQATQYAQHDIAALLAGIPSAADVSAPYQAAQARADDLTRQLAEQLRGEQTYRVNLATGLPEAQQAAGQAIQGQANQSAAALGGTASALPTTAAAGTLASFGTSAANQVAQQMASAPLAGAAYKSRYEQQLLDALNQRQLQVGAAQAKLPSLEDQYRQQLTTEQRAADTLAFQQRTAQQNYDLATGKAQSDAAYRAAQIKAQNARSAATIAAENKRAASSQENAWRIAQARIAAQKQAAGAASTKTRNTSLAAAEKYVNAQLETRYKPSAGKAGGVTGYDIAYSYADPSSDSEKRGMRHLTPQQYQAYKAQGATALQLPAGAKVTVTPRTSPGTPGRGATNPDRAVQWAVGYLSQQNDALGWGLDRATLTRMAQQSVRDSGLWPNYGRNTARRSAPRPGRSAPRPGIKSGAHGATG